MAYFVRCLISLLDILISAISDSDKSILFDIALYKQININL